MVKRSIFMLVLVLLLLTSALVHAMTSQEWLIRGKALFEQGDYDNSIVAFTNAIELKPDFAEAYYNRGNVYDAKHLYVQAFSDETRAIELDPNNDFLYFHRGNMYMYIEKTDLAIGDYEKAVNLKPQNSQYQYILAALYYDSGKKAEAAKHFKEALKVGLPYEYKIIAEAKIRELEK